MECRLSPASTIFTAAACITAPTATVGNIGTRRSPSTDAASGGWDWRSSLHNGAETSSSARMDRIIYRRSSAVASCGRGSRCAVTASPGWRDAMDSSNGSSSLRGMRWRDAHCSSVPVNGSTPTCRLGSAAASPQRAPCGAGGCRTRACAGSTSPVTPIETCNWWWSRRQREHGPHSPSIRRCLRRICTLGTPPIPPPGEPSVLYAVLGSAMGVSIMPKNEHLRGVGDKEQKVYEEIKESAEKEGRYKGREEE